MARMGHGDQPLGVLPVSPSLGGPSWGENGVCKGTEEARTNGFFLFFVSQVPNSAGEDQSLRHTACHRVKVTMCSFMRPVGAGGRQPV